MGYQTILVHCDAGKKVSCHLDVAAELLDIDLIVMGAYGHSRMRELVMGGVSPARQHDRSSADVALG